MQHASAYTPALCSLQHVRLHARTSLVYAARTRARINAGPLQHLQDGDTPRTPDLVVRIDLF